MRYQHPEDNLQRACAQLLDYHVALGRLRFSAVPLGGKRGKTEAARLKGLGVRSGCPDIIVAMKDGRTIWLELKSPDGTLKPAQKKWRDDLLKLGHQWFLIRDVAELHKILVASP